MGKQPTQYLRTPKYKCKALLNCSEFRNPGVLFIWIRIPRQRDGQSHGQTFRTQWFLSNETCTDTLLRDYYGKESSKTFLELEQEKAHLFTEDKVHSDQCMWTTLNWKERSRTWLTCVAEQAMFYRRTSNWRPRLRHVWKSCEVIRIDTEPRFQSPDPGSLPWETWKDRVGLLDATQRLHCKRPRCRAQEAFVRGGMTDFYESVNIGNHFLFKSCVAGSRIQVLLCRQPDTLRLLRPYAALNVCVLQYDTRRRHLQDFVRLCRTHWRHGQVPRVFFFLSARRRK